MITRQQAIDALGRHDDEIAQRLRDGQQAYEQAIEEAKQVRAGLVLEAIEAGWPMTKIGEQLGLSKQRVAQIRDEATTTD